MAQLEAAALRSGLTVLGGFHPEPGEAHLPEGTRTLLLLGPAPDVFWPQITQSLEFQDGAPDPVDRWSLRVVGDLAAEIGGSALFPFDGPPWLPFLGWSHRASRLWQSPAGLLVHAEAGLMVSIRGALALPERVELVTVGAAPCTSCAAPCTSACPVDALKGDHYDIEACKAHLRRPQGRDCLTEGCRARRACPLSPGAGRSAAQSAYHMARFWGAE